MISDLLIAGRGLRRGPAFTVAAIATLALGIGANTTMFSVVNSVLLRPLPGYETDRLVQICDSSTNARFNAPGSCTFLAPQVYQRLREQLHSFAPLSANQYCRMNLTGTGEPDQLAGPCTTANWFELKRAQAMLGRTFMPDEDQHGRNRVVVLDHGYWQRRFGGENLLVRTVGDPMGIARAVRHAVYLEARTVPLDDPQTLEERTSYLTDGPKRAMWLLGVFAGLTLLLAAVGIYGVSAYPAAQRSHEIGIRMALGAEFGDIARLVYRGALFPSAIGLAIGLGAAMWLTRLLKSLIFGVRTGDVRTLAMAGFGLLGISVLAATGPAIRAALSDPAKVLRRE